MLAPTAKDPSAVPVCLEEKIVLREWAWSLSSAQDSDIMRDAKRKRPTLD
jgi:hypothetical protein